MPEWLKRLAGIKSQEQIDKEIVQEILQENAASKLYTGRPKPDPLVDEHPGYYITMAAAQPGGLAIRALAPFAYKGIAQGLASGESALEAFAPGFKKLNSFQDLGALRQQLADQEFRALKEAQEAAAAKQQASKAAAERSKQILDEATSARTASSGRLHFTRRSAGSGRYVPVRSSGPVEKATVTAPTIQMPTMQQLAEVEAAPVVQRIKIKSSTDPFVNVTQSMQNAHDLGLPGLQSMFQSDMSAMHAPLLERLVDRTGRKVKSILGQIDPETGLIRTNFFGVKDPHQIYWKQLHDAVGTGKVTAKQAEELMQSNAMKKIFGNLQDLLRIDRKITPRINPNSIMRATSKIKAAETTPQVKAMAVKREENALRALQQLEDEAGVVTRIGPDGKPFKIMPVGFQYPTSAITTESLPLNFFNDVHVDDLGEYFILNGQKVHFKQGGVLSGKSGIHIKKKNRGKFTSWCGGKVTSECIARGKASSNPAIRKRATFAANARKWKH